MNDPQYTVKIYGHRGTLKYAPENTIEAFQVAIDQGADGFELDTMLSSDGIPVVIHDRSLVRTTNRTGFVDHHSVSSLKDLDAGSWFSPNFIDTEIPCLEEVMEHFGHQCEINIELKNMHHPFDALPEKVCALVKKFDLIESVLLSSFVPYNLVRVRKILPGVRVALLVTDDMLGRMLASRLMRRTSPDFIHPHHAICTQRFISNQHRMGRRINTWTVNDASMITSLIEKGIDGIITDDPISAVATRDQGEL